MANRIQQDYGTQPNQKGNKESFVDFQQRTTWFQAMTKALQRHSEFMRPELGDFNNMEYGYPGTPEQPPWRDIPPEDRDTELLPTGTCVLSCYAPLYCEDPVKCHFNISQGEPRGMAQGMTAWDDSKKFGTMERLTADRMSMPSHQTDSAMDALYRQSRGEGYSLPVKNVERRALTPDSNVFPIQIAAPTGGWSHWPDEPSNKLKVCAMDMAGNTCCTKISVFCRVPDCCQSSSYVVMTFDDGSTPDQVARNGSITLYMLNGCGPYVWTVSGTGFSLANVSTSGPTNILSLADNACGTHAAQATITVVDACTTSVSFQIKAADGTWESIGGWGESATCSGGACNCANSFPPPCTGASEDIYHYGVGAGGVYNAKWSMAYGNNCDGTCTQTWPKTIGTGSSCGSDVMTHAELSYKNPSYCACSGLLYYWTCGADCT